MAGVLTPNITPIVGELFGTCSIYVLSSGACNTSMTASASPDQRMELFSFKSG